MNFNFLVSFPVLLAIFVAIQFSHSAKVPCPPAEQLEPCTCSPGSYNWLRCLEIDTSELKPIFTQIANRTRNNPQHRHFGALELNNMTGEVIEADAFAGITFKRLYLVYNRQLKKIHVNATRSAGHIITDVYMNYNPKLKRQESSSSPYDFFAWLNTLPNLVQLTNNWSGLETIGEIKLPNLEALFMSWTNAIPRSNSTLDIAPNAFYNSPKLDLISFTSSGQIKMIGPKAFRMKNSTKSLRIQLVDTRLTSTSFAEGSLSDFNRPMHLSLNYNLIQYVNETIFKPFLTAPNVNIKNKLYLATNPLNCSDCRNFWLVKGQFKNQVFEASCDRNRSLPLFSQNWSHCK